MQDNWTAIQQTIEVLNRVHQADPSVLPQLITMRVPCNEALADDPTVQVGRVKDNRLKWEVGFLGIVNGIFGINEQGSGYIGAFFDDFGHLKNFGWVNTGE